MYGEFVKLQFVNSDARPKVSEIWCHAQSVAPIMAWYGAYYVGDRYYVTANGMKLDKDQNGELKEPTHD